MTRIVRQTIGLTACLLMIAAAAVTHSHRLLGYEIGAESKETQASPEPTVINTTDLGKDIAGFAGPTPVEIRLQDGKIAQIQAIPNQETPSFLNRVLETGLLDSWNGLTPSQALKVTPDAITGATYSSKALINNVHVGLSHAASLSPAPIPAPTPKPQFKLTLGWVIGIIVVLCGAFLPLFIHNRIYRIIQLIADVAVLGLWCGSFISYSAMVGFMAGGINLGAALLVIMLLVVGFLFPLFGRSNHYCMWLCPLGAAQELVGKLNPHKLQLRARHLRIMRYFRQGLWCLLMLLLWSGAWAAWMDYELFTAFLFRDASVWVLIVAAAFLIASLFIPRPFCQGVCPTGTLLKISQGPKA